MNIFTRNKTVFTGVIEDPRSLNQQMLDHLHEERALGGVENPFNNPQITQSKYPLENQQNPGSCVPHGVGLAALIERYADTGELVRLAPLMPYRLRANYPGAGSWLQDMFEKYRDPGAPIYSSLPTIPGMTEDEAARLVITQELRNEAAIYRAKNYFTLQQPADIVTLAEIAQRGHGVPILIYARYDEWAQQWPTIYDRKLDAFDAGIRHCVCVLPYSGFTMFGKRYVTIQDSAWFGGFKIRHVEEDFINNRVYGAGYWDTVTTVGGGPKPKHVFTKVLQFGARGDEVKALQSLLVSEGLLPIDCVSGLFAGRTLAGVKAFQNKYASEVLVPWNLDAPTGIFGSRSIVVANRLCQ